MNPHPSIVSVPTAMAGQLRKRYGPAGAPYGRGRGKLLAHTERVADDGAGKALRRQSMQRMPKRAHRTPCARRADAVQMVGGRRVSKPLTDVEVETTLGSALRQQLCIKWVHLPQKGVGDRGSLAYTPWDALLLALDRPVFCAATRILDAVRAPCGCSLKEWRETGQRLMPIVRPHLVHAVHTVRN